MPYTETVLDHFHAPRNHRRMENADVVGVAGDPRRGQFMQIFLRVAGGQIVEATFQTIGCCPAIAAGSLLTECLRGATFEQARAWTDVAISEALGGLPQEKRYCSALAADALTNGLTRWEAREGR